MSPSKSKTSDVKNGKKTVSNKLNSAKAQLLSITSTPKRREKPLAERIENLPYGSNLVKIGLPLPSGDTRAVRFRLPKDITKVVEASVYVPSERQPGHATFRVPPPLPSLPRDSPVKGTERIPPLAPESDERRRAEPASGTAYIAQTRIVSSQETTNTCRFQMESMPPPVAPGGGAGSSMAASASYLDAVQKFISIWTNPARLRHNHGYAVEIAQQAATVCGINELIPCIELICKSQGSNALLSETLDKMWLWVTLVLHCPIVQVQLRILRVVVASRYSAEEDYFRKIILANAYSKIERMLI